MPRPRTSASGGRSSGPAPKVQVNPAAQIDESKLLDTVDDGESIDFAPQKPGIGKLDQETATIIDAWVEKRVWKKKNDAGELELMDQSRYRPETVLAVKFRRDKTWEDGNPVETTERYPFGLFKYFAPSADGQRLRPQPEAVKALGRVPVPFSNSAASCFLRSLEEAGFDASGLPNGPRADLTGLRVFVRLRKDSTMKDNWADILLVDSIEGRLDIETADSGETAQDSADTHQAAEEAIVEILAGSEGSIAATQIPMALLKHDELSKDKTLRAQILKLVKDQSFIDRDDAPWTVEDGVLTLG